MAEGSPTSLLHLSIIRWIADNFYLCEGCTVPRWLLYELYMENCSPNSKYQVNSATFGKLIRLVFPGLGTRRLGTRGSTRYHYDGIAIKKDSSFYARYCSLLSEKNYHSGNACSYGDAAGYKSKSQKKRTTEQERFQYPWPEFSRFYLWEQELGKKYPYEMVVLLANEYYSHCHDILHMVRKSELDKVEDCIMSFWRSLQPERIALMSLPDVCQLFKSYDRQLFKEMENILLHDFLEEVPVQHMKSIRLFSKNVELWLLNALEEFPLPLQTSKSKEVTVFINRLRRKTDLSNMAKTMRTVLNSNSKVTVLRSDLHAVIDQGFLDVPGNLFQKKLRNREELQNDIELKYKQDFFVNHIKAQMSLNDLMSLLAPSTDIRVLLNCVSSNLQAFIIQPSRSKEEFRKLASDFQLRWNFLLSAVSKAMTLNYADSFDLWHGRRPTLYCKGFQPRYDSKVNGLSESLLAFSSYAPSCKLIQVILEETITKTSTKLDLPVGKEALLTQKDGQTCFIFGSDEQQIFRENQPDLKILYARLFLLFDTTLRNTVFTLLNLRSFSGNTKCKTVLATQLF